MYFFPQLLTSNSIKQERQERNVQAAALAECQRTILALGKQLKGLGTVNSQGQEAERELITSPKSTNASRSIEKMTENMELLRFQTKSAAEDAAVPSANPATNTYNLPTVAPREHGNNQRVSPSPRRAHRSPSPATTPARRSSGNGMTYPTSSTRTSDPGMHNRGESGRHRGGALEAGESTNGHSTPRLPSPARLERYGHGAAGSMPSATSRSSATTPWALRSTIRSKPDLNGSEPAQKDADASVEKTSRNSSSFSRFYSRTRSGSIGG